MTNIPEAPRGTDVYGTNGELPDVPEFLRMRAEALGLVITVLEPEDWGELDCGPFVLRWGDGYHVIWDGGLPAEGIADAINCFQREEEDDGGAAWTNFGEGWAAEAFSAKREPPPA